MRKFLIATAVVLLMGGQADAFWRVQGWADNSNNEDGFRIERKIGTTAYAVAGQVGPNVTTYNDTTSTAMATYCYRIVAYNQFGSTTGPELCAIAGSPTAPGMPQLLWIP